MFNNTKYTRWYFSIMRNPDRLADYAEEHHIIPKSLGGANTGENLVRLSARQHFVAHLLLTKMTDGKAKSKMCWALHKMAFSKSQNQERRFLAVEYEMARRIHAINVARQKSEEHQNRIAKALTGQKRTAEQKQRMSEAALKERATNPNNPNRKRSKEQQDLINQKLRNKPKSEEHKAKLKKPKSEEHRKKLSDAQTGKVASAETRAKLSVKGKGRKCKPRSKEHSDAIWASRRANAILKAEQSLS